MTIGGLGAAPSTNDIAKVVAQKTGMSVDNAETAIKQEFGNPIEDAAGSVFNFSLPSDGSNSDLSGLLEGLNMEGNKQENNGIGGILQGILDFFKGDEKNDEKKSNSDEVSPEGLPKIDIEKEFRDPANPMRITKPEDNPFSGMINGDNEGIISSLIPESNPFEPIRITSPNEKTFDDIISSLPAKGGNIGEIQLPKKAPNEGIISSLPSKGGNLGPMELPEQKQEEYEQFLL